MTSAGVFLQDWTECYFLCAYKSISVIVHGDAWLLAFGTICWCVLARQDWTQLPIGVPVDKSIAVIVHGGTQHIL